MKKWFKNSKGLTLVELLAVIVILGVIAAIAIPALGGTIQNSKEKADVATYDMIRDAAIRWSMDQQASGLTGNINYTTIGSLQTNGYLTDFQPEAQSNSNISFTHFSVTVDVGGTTTVAIYDQADEINRSDTEISK